MRQSPKNSFEHMLRQIKSRLRRHRIVDSRHDIQFSSANSLNWLLFGLIESNQESFFARRLDFFSRILHFRAYHASRHRAVLFKFHVFKCHSRPVKINELRNETLIFYFLSFPPPETTKFFTLVRRCNEWWCKISGLRQYTWPTVSTTTSRLRWPRSW